MKPKNQQITKQIHDMIEGDYISKSHKITGNTPQFCDARQNNLDEHFYADMKALDRIQRYISKLT